jgi:hypothetical protein
MAASNHNSVRFGVVTAIAWLVVAGAIILLLWNVITWISGSTLPLSTPTPNLTQVYATIAAMLAEQRAKPSTTSMPTYTPSPAAQTTQAPASPQPTRLSAASPTGATPTTTPGVLCDRASAGSPIDITIPDDSEMTPGQSFVKTWKLVNTGTCTWTVQYSTSFFYGDRMGAPQSVALRQVVQPAQDVEISIEMVAPQDPGTYQGNWKLSNPNGVLFGIGPNGDSPFWVRIIVPQEDVETPAPTVSFTPTITPTQVITPTETPAGNASGELSLTPGDAVDLDTINLNGDEEDLSYQTDGSGTHWLVPHEEALIGISGRTEPTFSDCQSTSMTPEPISVESLSTGTYFCYSTGEHRLGRALLKVLDPDDFTLTLDFLTWVNP